MSVLSRRSALRLELAALDLTLCTACAHPLSAHLLSAPEHPFFGTREVCSGGYADAGVRIRCRCKAWSETPADPQLPL